jgi:predicted transcriptional regulator of viral defense system
MNVNALSDWIDRQQSNGRYTFLRPQAIEATGLTPEAVKKSLQRLARKHRVVKVKDYFYVIVPTEYLNVGAPPATWFIADLMRAMRLPYYVGLLSAAALHGASHHQPQEFQVMTSVSQRPLRVARQRIRFYTKSRLEETPTTEVKTPTGMLRVSSPEATALDLVRFAKAAGYFGNVATVLGDLAERLRPDALLAAAEHHAHLPTVQRLGYLLDLVGAEAASAPLAALVEQRRPRAVPLRADQAAADATRDAKWNIFVNDEVEADL